MIIEYIHTKNNYKTINEVLINEFNLSNRLMTKLIKNKQTPELDVIQAFFFTENRKKGKIR